MIMFKINKTNKNYKKVDKIREDKNFLLGCIVVAGLVAAAAAADTAAAVADDAATTLTWPPPPPCQTSALHRLRPQP